MSIPRCIFSLSLFIKTVCRYLFDDVDAWHVLVCVQQKERFLSLSLRLLFFSLLLLLLVPSVSPSGISLKFQGGSAIVTANVRLFDFISFFFILFTGSEVITYTCNFFDWLLRLKSSRSKVGSNGVRGYCGAWYICRPKLGRTCVDRKIDGKGQFLKRSSWGKRKKELYGWRIFSK